MGIIISGDQPCHLSHKKKKVCQSPAGYVSSNFFLTISRYNAAKQAIPEFPLAGINHGSSVGSLWSKPRSRKRRKRSIFPAFWPTNRIVTKHLKGRPAFPDDPQRVICNLRTVDGPIIPAASCNSSARMKLLLGI